MVFAAPLDFRASPADAVFAAYPEWRVWDDREAGDPGTLLARDAALGEAVARGEAPPTFRLWRNRRALVVGRRQARLPGFDEAARRLEQDGWPVLVRGSGGGPVPHDGGILLLSLAVPRRDTAAFSIEALYRALCEPLVAALAELGIETEFGEVPGAFCDGRFNLGHGGRKLVGTAQRWRGGPAGTGGTRGHALAHALLLVDHDLPAACAAIDRFHALAGGDQRVEPGAMTTVRECLENGAATALPPLVDLIEAVRERVVAALAACLPGHV